MGRIRGRRPHRRPRHRHCDPARPRHRTRCTTSARVGSPWPRAGGARRRGRSRRGQRPRVRRRAPTGLAQERVGGDALRPLLAEPVGQLAEVPRRGGGVEVGRSPRCGSSRWDWVTMSKVRPTASTRSTAPSGSRPPPIRERGRRTPLAMTRSLPRWGVRTVRTRSASPRSSPRRTMASVLYRRAGSPAAGRVRFGRTSGSSCQMVADVDAEMRSILDEHRGPAQPLYEMLAYHLGLDGSDGSTGKRIRPSSASSSSGPWAATTGAPGRRRGGRAGPQLQPRPRRHPGRRPRATPPRHAVGGVGIPRPSTPGTPCSRCRGSRSTGSRPRGRPRSAGRPAGARAHAHLRPDVPCRCAKGSSSTSASSVAST